MGDTFQSLLAAARKQIKEVTVAEAKDLIATTPNLAIVDVREADEYRQGHIEGAVSIPRGFLEIRIEDKVPDREHPVLLY